MLRLILLFILFYFVFKGIRLFIKYFTAEVKKPNNVNGNTSGGSRYKDAEEVEFREIKADSKNKSEHSDS